MRRLLLIFVPAAILMADPVLVNELSPVEATEDQIQCGKFLAKTADGSWRVIIKGVKGDYPILVKAGDLFLEVKPGQKKTAIALDGKVERFWPTAEEAAVPCVANIPKYKKK